jgi:hypothetical protein
MVFCPSNDREFSTIAAPSIGEVDGLRDLLIVFAWCVRYLSGLVDLPRKGWRRRVSGRLFG